MYGLFFSELRNSVHRTATLTVQCYFGLITAGGTLEASWTAGEVKGGDKLLGDLTPTVAVLMALKLSLNLFLIILLVILVNDLALHLDHSRLRIQFSLGA